MQFADVPVKFIFTYFSNFKKSSPHFSIFERNTSMFATFSGPGGELDMAIASFSQSAMTSRMSRTCIGHALVGMFRIRAFGD